MKTSIKSIPVSERSPIYCNSRFYTVLSGKQPTAVNVEHSFVEKVMAVFKDQVEKTKQEFIESLKSDDESIEMQMKRLTSNIDEKLEMFAEEQSRIKGLIFQMKGLLTQSLNQASSLRRTNTKP